MKMTLTCLGLMLAELNPIPFYLKGCDLPANTYVYDVKTSLGTGNTEVHFVSNSFVTNGQMGALWDAYAVNNDTARKLKGVVTFHPRAFYQGPYDGASYAFLVYQRTDSRHGKIFKLFVADDEISSTLIKSLDFEAAEEAAQAEYDALFLKQNEIDSYEITQFIGKSSFKIYTLEDPSQTTVSTTTDSRVIDYAPPSSSTLELIIP